MAQNITLLGASYSDVPAVTLPKTGGGTARFDDCSVVTASASDVASGKIFIASDGTITTGTSSGGGGGGGDYPWFGPNTIKDYTKTITINLANDTSWDSWTASTTGMTILAAPTTADFSYTFNATQYSATVVTQVATNYVYKSTATRKTIPIVTAKNEIYFCYGIPSTYEQLVSGDVGVDDSFSKPAIPRMLYYNGNGSKARGSTQYGAYLNGSPTISPSFSNGNITFTYKRSSVSARCNSTYFATARKADIDSANTNIVITVDVYKTPRMSAFSPVEFENMRLAMLAAPENQ